MAQESTKRGLVLGESLHGFTVERIEELPEIDGTAYIMRHTTSGTPLMWLANDDENKSFSITFKTPPADDTGVFHILEHSVLCGSERYPVKEPFVNLLKTSMQTFLNALTFADKTMYPVASTNERDLLNLMDVYMDAVLHPLLYTKREIFEQEGWHYETEDEAEEDAPVDLYYNGVVFNEMKGALADPDEIALNCLSRALFPDTAYRFESGGNPRVIPTLTYEDFLDSHARHYELHNAHIVLYGDISLDPELELLDERYLSCAPQQAGAPNPLDIQEPVIDLDAACTMATAPENAVVMCGYVIGTAQDRTRSLAIDILNDALMGSNEAPLKRALLDADLGGDVDAFVYDGILQPYILFEVRNAKEGIAETFREVLEKEFSRMVREGIPRENLEASLESTSFSLRERDFGYADGVALAINAMSGWLYDDAMPCDYLQYEDALSELRAGLDTAYWEDLVQSVFLDSPHHACCTLTPIDAEDPDGAAAQEAAELAQTASQMDRDDLSAIASEVAELRRVQDEPDTPEALATLPHLTVADIGSARPEPAYYMVDHTPLPCLYHEVSTRKIDYVYHYFDLSSLSWDELPYASLITALLGKLDTASHTAAQLDTLIEARLGRFACTCGVHENDETGDAVAHLIVGVSSIAENVADLATLPAEIWSQTDFSDTDKIRTILEQQRIESEMAFANSGNSYALSRAWGYTSQNSMLAQHFGNVDYYRFIRGLLADWEHQAQELPAILTDICSRIFITGSNLHSFTGERADLDRYWEAGQTLSLGTAAPEVRLVVPEPCVQNEAFIVPTDICFVAKADSGRDAHATYSGYWPVATHALNYDYLWNEIRVKGGAYGCGLRIGTNGNLGFYTYRDPNLDASLARMDAAADYLSNFDPSLTDMDGYIVSSVANHDAPQRPRQIARRQDTAFICGREPEWREQIRSEELAATPEDIRPLAEPLSRVAERNAVCVFGSREIIEHADADLTVVDLIGCDQ